MVYLHLADGFEEIEALAVVDLLRRAGVDLITVSIMERLAVVGGQNISVIADILFEDADYDNCEMMILPGGLAGSERLARHIGLKEKTIAFNAKKGYIAAICAAPAVALSAFGIIKNKEVACYPADNFYEMVNAADAKVAKEKVFICENIITSMGIGTVYDFAFKLMEILTDMDTVEKVKKGTLLSHI